MSKYVLAIGCIPPLTWWTTLAMTDIWVWFIVPLGLPAIGQWHALGLLTFLYIARPARASDFPIDDLPFDKMLAKVLTAFAMVGVWYGVAALIHGLGGVS